MPGFDTGQFRDLPNVTYGGEVSKDIIAAAMDDHDVLLFPSYYDGE